MDGGFTLPIGGSQIDCDPFDHVIRHGDDRQIDQRSDIDSVVDDPRPDPIGEQFRPLMAAAENCPDPIPPIKP